VFVCVKPHISEAHETVNPEGNAVQLATYCSLHIPRARGRHLGALQLYELGRRLLLNTDSAMQNQLNEGVLSQLKTEEMNK